MYHSPVLRKKVKNNKPQNGITQTQMKKIPMIKVWMYSKKFNNIKQPKKSKKTFK
jgi:hypothetical protein